MSTTLSPSQLKVWLTCEEQWRLAYREKLKSKGSNPIFFEKGSYVHEIMHYYYSLIKAGFPVGSDIALKAVENRIKEDISHEIDKAKAEGRSADLAFYRDTTKAIITYIKFISPKIDSKITEVEHEYHLETKSPAHDVVLHGYIDLLYWDSIRKKRVIRDHKTGARNVWTNKKVEQDIQLLMYGTLWYILTGEVAIVQISFLNTSQASNPKATTTLYGSFEAHHTEQTYIKFWEYLRTILVRMENPQTLQNLNACGSCAYSRICRAGLRGYSADRIKTANFYGPHNKPIEQVQEQDTDGSETDSKPFHFTFGR
jgi:hypothetical protein